MILIEKYWIEIYRIIRSSQDDEATFVSRLSEFNLPNVGYDVIAQQAKYEKRLQLDDNEMDIIHKIAMPLKRNGYYREAHNAYKFIYHRFGLSSPLCSSWFKVLACVGMFDQAMQLLIASNNIYFNTHTREDLHAPWTQTQMEMHIDQLEQAKHDSVFRLSYLTSISGNRNYSENFIDLDENFISPNLPKESNGETESDKQNKYKEYHDSIYRRLELFDLIGAFTVPGLKEQISDYQKRLNKIKEITGSNDNDYLEISTLVAKVISEKVVGAANDKTINLEKDNISQDFSSSTVNNSKIHEIVDSFADYSYLLTLLLDLDLEHEARNAITNNRNDLDTIVINLKQSLRNKSKSSKSTERQTQNSGGGCYIATMAFGDYEHPQVIKLRNYRDSRLTKTFYGRLFIKSYYAVSPYLVKILKNQKIINMYIRMMLNRFIKSIERDD